MSFAEELARLVKTRKDQIQFETVAEIDKAWPGIKEILRKGAKEKGTSRWYLEKEPFKRFHNKKYLIKLLEKDGFIIKYSGPLGMWLEIRLP